MRSYSIFHTIFEHDTTSNKQIDPNQPKHWHECTEYVDNESDDEDNDINNDSEDPVMLHILQVGSEESEDPTMVERD